MLKLVNSRKFPPMTFKLNGATHFLAGIAATHISSALRTSVMEGKNGSDERRPLLALKERVSDTILQMTLHLTPVVPPFR